jgi:adenylate cyclase class 2
VQLANPKNSKRTLYIPGKGIDARSAVLRLRRTGARATLTYKKRYLSRSAIKRQQEEETEVADADAVDSILRALGYKVALVYEKRRLTWTLDETEIVIDELPFGWFMEIEGSETEITKVERKLGASGLEAELETYPALTRIHGTENGDVIEARFAKSSGRSNRTRVCERKDGLAVSTLTRRNLHPLFYSKACNKARIDAEVHRLLQRTSIRVQRTIEA